MAFGYVVKKGCEFRLDGKHFATGDSIVDALARKLEAEPHLLGFCIRVVVDDAPVVSQAVKPTEKPAVPAS